MGHPLDGKRFGDDLVLRRDAQGLGLYCLSEPKTSPLRVDFSTGKIQRRARDALASQHLLRAAGGGGEVLDATAGLGRDAFLLACAGKQVLMLERNPVVHALLADGLGRAAADPELAPVVARMQLLHTDFREFNESRRFDTVFLDPMFPQARKRSRVKKEMVFLQRLLNEPEPEPESKPKTATKESGLLDRALDFARDRVVVKRPLRESWLKGVKPAFSYSGRLSRFDVYLPPVLAQTVKSRTRGP